MARLCGVTKHTLFHYHQIGVFSPAVIGENGYRYYTTPQVEVFAVISTLRELGMPLSQIKAYLDRRSPEELVALLDQEDVILGEKIARLGQMRKLIQHKSALTRQAMRLPPGQITVEDLGIRRFVMTPLGTLHREEEFTSRAVEHTRRCQELGIVSPHAIGALLRREAVEQGDLIQGYTHCYTQVEKAPRRTPLFTAPEGRYLTLYHTGGYAALPASYRRLLDWAQDHGAALDEYFWEDTLLDDLSVKGYDNYLLKLSIRLI
jgi:DNA-binding transcriptional MerR regulator